MLPSLSCFLLAALALLCGCELFDPPMAEVGMHITKDGHDCSCLVQVFNDQGKQVQEVASSQMGVVYIKRLMAGTWTFKFKGREDEMYPAVRTLTLISGATATIEIDVNKAKDPEGEAAASASVRTYGEDDASN